MKQLSESEIKAEVRRIAEVRAGHPQPPPGVRTFSMRRYRRTQTKHAMRSRIRDLEEKLGGAQLSKKALANLADRKAQELREAGTWRGALRTLWRKVWPWA